MEWWYWLVIGLALIAIEITAPGMVLLWFGVGALGVALLLALIPALSLVAQLLIWSATSCALLVLWFRVFRNSRARTLAGTSSGDVLGEIGLLTRDIAAFGRGQVRFQKPLLGADLWDCIADEPLAAGERVKVAAIEGSLLKVARIHHSRGEHA
ncbi:NfeD family protein [Methyloversatilis thermotolerans]|uniref:NfeD family protein n=1 Tax=Methyloversatilis thermotolerans TaxID=1346290 RepID=UPI000381C714|nr:NfeD family protein [Methyloversatilis thermotolerans]